MVTIAGILVLIAGVILPMVMVGWLARRMGRKPALSPGRVGLLLAFNGVLPVGLVLLGLGLLSPGFWSATWVRVAAIAACVAAVVILILLGMSRQAAPRGNDA